MRRIRLASIGRLAIACIIVQLLVGFNAQQAMAKVQGINGNQSSSAKPLANPVQQATPVNKTAGSTAPPHSPPLMNIERDAKPGSITPGSKPPVPPAASPRPQQVKPK